MWSKCNTFLTKENVYDFSKKWMLTTLHQGFREIAKDSKSITKRTLCPQKQSVTKLWPLLTKDRLISIDGSENNWNKSQMKTLEKKNLLINKNAPSIFAVQEVKCNKKAKQTKRQWFLKPNEKVFFQNLSSWENEDELQNLSCGLFVGVVPFPWLERTDLRTWKPWCRVVNIQFLLEAGKQERILLVFIFFVFDRIFNLVQKQFNYFYFKNE